MKQFAQSRLTNLAEIQVAILFSVRLVNMVKLCNNILSVYICCCIGFHKRSKVWVHVLGILFVFKEMNTFSHQGQIKLIRSDSTDIYNVFK